MQNIMNERSAQPAQMLHGGKEESTTARKILPDDRFFTARERRGKGSDAVRKPPDHDSIRSQIIGAGSRSARLNIPNIVGHSGGIERIGIRGERKVRVAIIDEFVDQQDRGRSSHCKTIKMA